METFESRDASYSIAYFAVCSNVDVLVIGAGPTGLGAAKRLNHIVGSPLPRSRFARFANLSHRMDPLG